MREELSHTALKFASDADWHMLVLNLQDDWFSELSIRARL